MADNNVFILFEEIKTALKGINGKLEELLNVAGQHPQIENHKPDLSPIKEAVMETTKAQSGEIKGMLDKHWKVYAQLSTLILQQLDTIKKSQSEQHEQGVPQEPQAQEHIHRHSFDIKSSKVLSFVVGLGAVCALSLWGNVAQWQSKRQYVDDALKFRVIRSWGGCDANDVLWLNKVFDIHRDEKAIEWVRKQANGYETSLKAASDSLMQESIKSKSD
ncbi:hypothetical protein KQP54_07820 [Bacteroides uniformis]|jgi:hypothetical protein|uniref:hypothetical protein n=1 Tax=Bacteroides TaxID=816 RepID=UPI000E53A9D9|nr:MULTISPECIES: hypothetical protein [Bacteroides]MCM0259612.1 hypothetical protein [Bacteroides fragilis]NTS08039.1 hypothetical protein [Bacteroides fragilis]NTS18008.1 hypothetical protein [Bacteroides fragilis]RHK70895.1 hypothetical protein DW051_08025 [Bacteroides uniformis]RJV54208.1 hypothetical protein DWX15_07265 [Bacteroides sp. AF18-33]